MEVDQSKRTKGQRWKSISPNEQKVRHPLLHLSNAMTLDITAKDGIFHCQSDAVQAAGLSNSVLPETKPERECIPEINSRWCSAEHRPQEPARFSEDNETNLKENKTWRNTAVSAQPSISKPGPFARWYGTTPVRVHQVRPDATQYLDELDTSK